MKKKVIISIIVVVLGFSVSVTAEGTYSGGTGEPNDPYLIATPADMNEIGVHPNDWNDCFILTADINLADYNETNFNIIGPNSTTPFTGVFDGNGHTISNFTWNSATAGNVGLFGRVNDPNAEIKDLRLIDPNVQGGGFVGALVGLLQDGEITGCSVEGGTISGDEFVGGLVGCNEHGTVSNCYATGSVTRGGSVVGGLVGFNISTISNCYATGSVTGNGCVGGLAGLNWGTISNCYAAGSVTGNGYVGGLAGSNRLFGGTISNCYATGEVSGDRLVGGLAGQNRGAISNCYATGSVTGDSDVGGLAGLNSGTISSNCYATGSVFGDRYVGGLAGQNDRSTISNCYAAGSVSGNSDVGGLVGWNNNAYIFASFWDTQTSGQANGVGLNDGSAMVEVYGRTTAQMQIQVTFTDYGWDFVDEIINGTEDIWKIDDGNDYPRLWWEIQAPVLLEEPQFTLGTTNTIYWEPVPDTNDYYSECANDCNFENIIASSGWITDTSYEFSDLQLNQQYFYRVKALNSCDFESGWSNIESSLQTTLADAVDILFDANSLKNPNQKASFLKKIEVVEAMIEQGRYHPALKKLYNDILAKTDGCENEGAPDKNDWIITCDAQSDIYPLIMDTIDYVMYQMEAL